jgi:SHS family lactate transporter-like MFS transporter
VVVAVFVVLLAMLSPEPAAFERTRASSLAVILRSFIDNRKTFAYLVLLMTVITCLSHGTQDLYPDFLKSVHGFSGAMVSNLAILYNVGAILGALVIGHLSQRIGRRRSILLALGICTVALWPWAFGSSLGVIAVGAFVLQFGVQGVFGVVPAHLNELSPSGARSLFAGVVYQLGMLCGAPCVGIEFWLRSVFGYSRALTLFEVCTIAALFLTCLLSLLPASNGYPMQFSAKNKSPFPREGRFAGPVWMALVHSYRHRRGLRNGARTRT